MATKIEKLDGSMAKLTIEVSAEDFEKALNAAYQKQKGKIQLPGFRKGKAPRALIEKMYGKDVFSEDAANSLIPTEYAKAYDEVEEEITSSPVADDIEVVQIEAGKPFIFTVTVALRPEVKLGKYKGVSIDEVDETVSEEEVDARINQERENSARRVEVTDRAVADKDIVTLDFEGFVDGVAFEGGKGENYPLTIGSGQFIPGFEEQLIGAEIGKETEVNVTFPKDYQSSDLAGKAATFKCTIHKIEAKELPELDDEFASDVSEFETFAEYKADTRKKLETQKAEQVKEAKRDAALAAAIEDVKIDIPEAMLSTEQRRLFDQFAQRLSMQGMQVEQYLQYTGQTRDGMIEQLKPQAEESIKSRLTLEEIAKAEGLEATDDEYKEEIQKMADAYKLDVAKIEELMGDTTSIRKDIACRKAADFLVENAKMTKAKKTTKKAAAKDDDAEAEEKPAKKTAAKKTTATKTTTSKAKKEEAAEGEEKPKRTRKTTKKTEE